MVTGNKLQYLKELTSQLQNKDKEVDQKNELLDLVMDSIACCAWVLQPEEGIIKDNCGCSLEKVFGKEIKSLDDLRELSHPEDLSKLELVMENLKNSTDKIDVCHRIKTPQGENKMLHTMVKTNDDGKIVGFSVEITPNSDLCKLL